MALTLFTVDQNVLGKLLTMMTNLKLTGQAGVARAADKALLSNKQTALPSAICLSPFVLLACMI